MKKVGTLVAGVLAGLGIGLLVAPKTGEETRKELKKQFDDVCKKLKDVDYGEVKNDIEAKIGEIKEELNHPHIFSSLKSLPLRLTAQFIDRAELINTASES